MTYRFGAFALDTERYELRREGETVELEPKVLEVLAYLVAKRHRVVGKDELVEKVWRGRFVSDSALSRAIREVRRALGDTAAESNWVKTVYGRGFAFVQEAVEVDRRVEGPDPAAGLGADARDPRLGRQPLPSPLSSLVGRERELAEICALLARTRLMTLTGAGGAGKTRLAIETARRLDGRFASGAAFVALADIAEPGLLAAAIARVLGTGDAAGSSPEEALRGHIADRHLLLILDNFEHLVEVRGLVAELLSACPNLSVLVTSRFVLQLDGEQEYGVAPLDLPPADAAEGSLEDAPAVTLFLQRARSARHDFSPSRRDLAYIAEICRRLDGLPLAIELAAARIKVLAPRDLWQRLAARSDLLGAPADARPRRHRSLELALGWSYELLSEDERALLRRLSVFAGGCSLPVAERVCRVEGAEALDLLTALVDKSLVHRLPEVAGESRFGLLETTRAFARAQLESSEAADLRRAHAEWVLELARQAEAHLTSGDQGDWFRRLDGEHANLLAALAWARSDGDPAVGLAIAAAVSRFWSARGIYRQGRRELEKLLASAEGGKVDLRLRADARTALGMLCLLMCDYPAAARVLEEAREILETLDDRHRLADTLNHLGWVLAQGPELDRAEALARQALALHRELGNARGVSVALNNLGWAALYRGDPVRSEEHFTEALTERRAAGDERGVAFALANRAVYRLLVTDRLDGLDRWLDEARSLVDRLGDQPLRAWVLAAQGALAARREETDLGFELLEESLAIGRETPHPDGRAWCLLLLAGAQRDRGDLVQARRGFEEARRIWGDLGVPWGVALTGWRLAEVARDQGRDAESRALFEESLSLFEQLGARDNLEACRRASRAS